MAKITFCFKPYTQEEIDALKKKYIDNRWCWCGYEQIFIKLMATLNNENIIKIDEASGLKQDEVREY